MNNRGSVKILTWLYAALIFGAWAARPQTFSYAAVDQRDDAGRQLIEARSLAKEGKTEQAVAAYRRAVETMNDDAAVRIELARLLARSPATRVEAEKFYGEAAALSPRDIELSLERAFNLVAAGDTVNAALEYRRGFEVSPQNKSAADGYVNQITRLGATPVALKQLSQSLSAAPGDVPTRLLFAELLRRERRFSDAIEQYKIVQRIEPGNGVALDGAAEAWLALGFLTRAEQAFALAKKSDAAGAGPARVQLAAGRAEAALSLLIQQASESKESPALLSVLAETYRALGQASAERAALAKLRGVSSLEELTAVLARSARVSYELKDEEAAKKVCRELVALDPFSAYGRIGLSVLGAPRQLNAAKSVAPEINTPARQSGYQAETGEAALFWSQTETAAASLKEALIAQPKSPRLMLSLGAALFRGERFAEAAALFADVAVAEGRRPDALLGWALSEARNNSARRAADVLSELLSIEPDNFSALLAQVEVRQKLGEQSESLLQLISLARRAPEHRAINVRLRETLLAYDRPFREQPTAKPQFLVAGTPFKEGLQFLGGRAAVIEPLIQPGDTVRVKAPGRARYLGEVVVGADGAVSLPFLDRPLSVRCRTEREAEAVLSKQSSAAGAEVTLIQLRRLPLYVAGEVFSPNGYFVSGSLDLREGMMLASGATPRAGRTVFVVRGGATVQESCSPEKTQPKSDEEELEVYSRAAVELGRVEMPRPLRAGDLVFVPPRDAVFIAGGIERPDMLSANGVLTITDVLERHGGLTADARRDRVRLRRLLPNGVSYQVYPVNLNDIADRRAGDVILRPGDIVEIPAGGKEVKSQNSLSSLLRRLSVAQRSSIRPGSPQRRTNKSVNRTEEKRQ